MNLLIKTKKSFITTRLRKQNEKNNKIDKNLFKYRSINRKFETIYVYCIKNIYYDSLLSLLNIYAIKGNNKH